VSPRHAAGRVLIVALAAIAATCSAPTEPGPVVVEPPVVLSVTPNTGPLSGGTSVTIRGLRFGPAATITIGGRDATDLNVQGGDLITAKTPAGTTAATVDVVVSLNGRTGMLAGGFKYEAAPASAPPVIQSIAGKGKRLGEPLNFADHGETIQITAVVVDPDTPAAELVFEWQACGGTFIGTGAQVDWRAPTTGTLPPTCMIDLTVMDGSNRVSSSLAIRLHDSAGEVGYLALEFLTDFADSSIPAATTVRNFSDSCDGKAAELADITENRQTRKITSHTYGVPSVTVAFGGICAFRDRPGDACVATPVEWRSTILKTGELETAKGTSYITAIYANSRWWLCRSEWQGTTSTGIKFMQ